MPEEHHYFVYILSSRSRTLYIGVTNNLSRRLQEHRDGSPISFTRRYRIDRLVYVERFQYIDNAIAREKYLKHFTRAQKLPSSPNPIPPGRTSHLDEPDRQNLLSFATGGESAFLSASLDAWVCFPLRLNHTPPHRV
jgi:putative endonuclease